MGGTNVVEYTTNMGLVWFLKNHRGSGTDNIVGAGVATVMADANGAIAMRSHDTLWTSDEPYWGDIGVTYDPLDERVYVFGHGPTALDLKANVYLARVQATEATNIDAYEYWDQAARAWTDERFGDGRERHCRHHERAGNINVRVAWSIEYLLEQPLQHVDVRPWCRLAQLGHLRLDRAQARGPLDQRCHRRVDLS